MGESADYYTASVPQPVESERRLSSGAKEDEGQPGGKKDQKLFLQEFLWKIERGTLWENNVVGVPIRLCSPSQLILQIGRPQRRLSHLFFPSSYFSPPKSRYFFVFLAEINSSRSAYVDESGVVSLLDVVEDGGLVEAGQVGHVLDLVELGRVHLLDVVLGDEDALAGLGDVHLDLLAAVLLDGGRDEALVLVGHPHQPLLGPFRLLGGVVDGVAVHQQVLEVGVVLVGVTHLDGFTGRRRRRHALIDKLRNK